jgi:hypothetical protein
MPSSFALPRFVLTTKGQLRGYAYSPHQRHPIQFTHTSSPYGSTVDVRSSHSMTRGPAVSWLSIGLDAGFVHHIGTCDTKCLVRGSDAVSKAPDQPVPPDPAIRPRAPVPTATTPAIRPPAGLRPRRRSRHRSGRIAPGGSVRADRSGRQRGPRSGSGFLGRYPSNLAPAAGGPATRPPPPWLPRLTHPPRPDSYHRDAIRVSARL